MASVSQNLSLRELTWQSEIVFFSHFFSSIGELSMSFSVEADEWGTPEEEALWDALANQLSPEIRECEVRRGIKRACLRQNGYGTGRAEPIFEPKLLNTSETISKRFNRTIFKSEYFVKHNF